MSNRDRYLKQAAACERMAKRSPKPDAIELLRMAALWRDLAETEAAVEWRREITEQLGPDDEIDVPD